LKIPINAPFVGKEEISAVFLILEIIHPKVTLKNIEYVAISLREAQ